MKAVAIKGIKELEVVEIKEPVRDGNKVLIHVTKNGICGSDIHNWDAGSPVGLVMGHEFCGTVYDKGSRDDLEIGERVTALPISPCGKCDACLTGNVNYCASAWTEAIGLSIDNPGGLTSKIAVRPDMVLKVPENISDEEVAMAEPTAVGLHAVKLADIKVGDKVLVVGGGIIGLVSAMFAKMEGASYVAVSETNQARGKKALETGVCDEYLDALNPNLVNEMVTKLNGGFDVVIECCGNGPAVTSALCMAKPGSKVILVGVSATPITIPTVVGVMKELTMIGAIAYTKKEFETCLDLMSNRQIDVLKFVSDVVGLEDTQKAFETLTSGTSDVIKILVDSNK